MKLNLWVYLVVSFFVSGVANSQAPPKSVTLTGTATITYTPPTTVKGDKGDPGPKGDKGDPGKDGKDGQSIVGPKGDPGKDGKDGRDGKDGKGSGGASWPGPLLSAADNPGDARAAIQDAIDKAGKSSVTLAGQFRVGGPVYLDNAGNTLAGFDGAASVTGENYGGPVLAVGVRRLEKSGLDPKDFRRVTGSLDASAAQSFGTPRASLATRGKAALFVPSHPASLGGPFPNPAKPDYWQADAYTWDLLVESGDSGLPVGNLVGVWGADEPQPFGFVCDPGSGVLRFFWKTAGTAMRQFSHLDLPIVGQGPWRMSAQWDGKTGRTDFWVNDAHAVDQSAPGKLFKPTGVFPLHVGGADFVCSGFRATRGLVYAQQATLARRDGALLNDSSRFFDNLKSDIDPALGYAPLQTFVSLPLYDPPATHVQVNSVGWTGVGFWVSNKTIWSEDLAVKSLTLTSQLQPAVLIGPAYRVTIDDSTFAGGTQGLASMPTECTYPLRLHRVSVSGDDCAMFLHQVICYATDVTFFRSGRECLRFDGGSFYGDKLFVAFTNDATECFFRFLAQGYGNTHRLTNVLVDNEAFNPNLTSAIEMEASLYCVNRLLLDGVDLGGLPPAAAFLHLTSNNLGATVDARNLSVFGATTIGLKVDGKGWSGDFDGRGLSPFQAAGDVGLIKVTQPLSPIPVTP